MGEQPELPVTPPSVDWWMTSLCNLTCDYCWGPVPSKDDRSLRSVIAESILASRTPAVTFCGGEPLVVGDDVWTYSRAFREAGKKTILNTNGELLESSLDRDPQRAITDHFDVVGISVDAVDPDVHRDMRGKRATLARAMKAISLVRDSGVQLKIATVVSNVNKDHIADMARVVNETIQPSVWRLYQYSSRGEYNRGVDRHRLDTEEFVAVTEEAKRIAGNVNVAASESATASCFIVSQEAKILLPVGDDYEVLGDVRHDSIDSLWRQDPLAPEVVAYKTWLQRV
ncbi:4Fe-4S single cluster domain-containing protein [Lentzea xinjiangensis]|uniref:4Fe-4S single cluster domain-containing protein n=1 Tax=Lentzea xinjiangensis TaxID=402600 RepID=A0A1H9WQB7_9PSEU|nr:radical SAM protein [Lentzea xinjiangensis]SES36118.1 4Fe-4S single cluster domain-containing protein [Lentzea xinjiangensis]